MHKPDYIPTLTQEDFFHIRGYAPCTSEAWLFFRDLMDVYGCHGETKKDTENLVFFLVDVYNMGRVSGIREERHNRRMKKGQLSKT